MVTFGNGTVFKLTPPAAGQTAWTNSVLHDFGKTSDGFTGDGAGPQGALVMDSAGALYGTTAAGGTGGLGTVFRLAPPAPGQIRWTETILHSFFTNPNSHDGAAPSGPLALDGAGNVYGTTVRGGAGTASCPGSAGVVFELSPPRAGKVIWTETILHEFGICPGEVNRVDAGLTMGPDGSLFGAGSSGGLRSLNNNGGIFKLTPPAAGTAAWGYKVIREFNDVRHNDGAGPEVAPTVGPAGALFGTTAYGGKFGWGTIYELTPPPVGSTTWTETLLHSFNSFGGLNSSGVMLDASGALYGTVLWGGKFMDGTLYRLSPPAVDGGVWKSTALITFNGKNGAVPLATPIVDANGVIYGTTTVRLLSNSRRAAGTVYQVVQ